MPSPTPACGRRSGCRSSTGSTRPTAQRCAPTRCGPSTSSPTRTRASEPCLTPHGIYTVSAESLAWVAEQSATRDLSVHLHYLEIEDEVTGCLERNGERPGPYLERLGLLTPRTVLAHGVWMEDAELEAVAAGGATVVTNPVSNLKLAVGRVFPYAAVRTAGIPVGLGTDGASSNNGLDLFQDVKVLSLLQKHARTTPRALPADEAWAIATGARAPFLGGVPVLVVGAPADFVLVRADAPELGPGHLDRQPRVRRGGSRGRRDGGRRPGADARRACPTRPRSGRRRPSGPPASGCCDPALHDDGCPNTSRSRPSKCSRGSVSYAGSNACWSQSSANVAASSNHGSSRYRSRASGSPPKWW